MHFGQKIRLAGLFIHFVMLGQGLFEQTLVGSLYVFWPSGLKKFVGGMDILFMCAWVV